jgi:uncharacterized protein YbjT (DUF2867 family)
MKVLIFGASGMVGQGVVRECLLDPGITRVIIIGRRPSGISNPKLREFVQDDVADLGPAQQELPGLDACYFCLGVSAVGMDEASYRQVTYDLTLRAAQQLAAQGAAMTFIYVSGRSTDSSSGMMWARVKGATENALLALPFRAAYMFRPGYIQPMHGIRSSTRLYRLIYAVLGPLYPLLQRIGPDTVTTTEKVGLAMIEATRHGAPSHLLENRDINALAAAAMTHGR